MSVRRADRGASTIAPATVTAAAGASLSSGRETHGAATGQRGTAPPTSVGRYLIIDELGRGGMGVVLRAYDPKLQREVALKSMRRDGGGTERSAHEHAAMLGEAQAMAMLSHPNVVAVYDVESFDDEIFIAMELVRGTTLKAWLEAPRPWREVLESFCAAGRGLAAAHAAGLLHRDFKPANVLVGDDGRVRVTDFGLARAHRVLLGDVTEGPDATAPRGEWSGAAGTPRYMAPEQYELGEITAAADQYAFCVALWEALTGRPPFASASAEETAQQKRQGPPPWPRSVAIPRPVRDAICQGLAAQVNDRWPSMDALLEALARSCGPRHRHPRWLAMASLPVIATASGMALHVVSERRAERCSGAREQLLGVWDARQRARVAEVFTGASLDYAQSTWQRVAPLLDAYTARWEDMYRSTCEATTVHGHQPSDVMDLRMACLHRAKIELRAVTDLLAGADAQVIEKAHEVVGGLADVSRCGDVAALRADVAPPAAALVAVVEALRGELAAIKALRKAGKYSDALARTRAVAERARDELLAYPPLRTDMLVELGLAYGYTAQHAEAEAAYKQALRSAVSHRQWSQAVFAAAQLVENVGWQQPRPIEALAYAETAKALLPLEGATAAMRSALRSSIGGVLDALGRWGEAEVEYRAAVNLAEQAYGSDHLDTASRRAALALNLRYQNRAIEAEQEQRHILNIRESVLGPEHPEVGHARYDLGVSLSQQNRNPEAEAELRAAMLVWEKSLGPDHLNTATVRTALATTLAEQGQTAEAEAELRLALAVQRKILGSDHILVSITQTSLGNTYTTLGRYDEAETHLREAVATAEKVYGPHHPHVAATRSFFVKALLMRRDYRRAEPEARATIDAFEHTAERASSKAAFAYSRLGAALAGLKRYADAEAAFRKAIAIGEHVLPPEHPDLALYRNDLSAVLQAQSRRGG